MLHCQLAYLKELKKKTTVLNIYTLERHYTNISSITTSYYCKTIPLTTGTPRFIFSFSFLLQSNLNWFTLVGVSGLVGVDGWLGRVLASTTGEIFQDCKSNYVCQVPKLWTEFPRCQRHQGNDFCFFFFFNKNFDILEIICGLILARGYDPSDDRNYYRNWQKNICWLIMIPSLRHRWNSFSPLTRGVLIDFKKQMIKISWHFK
jgi:hypothetical protein